MTLYICTYATFILPFPMIDPVMLHLGPLKIHWYGIAYVLGIVLGWQYAAFLAEKYTSIIKRQHIDDSVMWALVGIIAGGRLGQVLFYRPDYYFSHPEEILMVWKGGMSFHGGLLGLAIALGLFCWKRKVPFLVMADLFSAAGPIGLLLGRIANFINGELYGRVTDVPWAVVFPHGGDFPRHPSQLYEALLEGLILWGILYWAWRTPSIRNVPGRIMGILLFGYGLARIAVEMVREPEIPGEFLWGTTWGQWLSLPMVLVGLYFCFRQSCKAELGNNGKIS